MKCVAVWLLLFQAAPPSPVPRIPDSPGVYYCQGDRACISLPKAPILETRTKGLELFVDTGGYSNLGINVTCSGAKASTRISVPKPTFYVRAVGPSSDIMIIQLTKKSQSRTFHTSSGSSTVENKEGFKKTDIRKTAVAAYSEGVVSVRPEVDLKAGEYLLVVGTPENSFDFGIDPGK